jgi:hypothetical protein
MIFNQPIFHININSNMFDPKTIKKNLFFGKIGPCVRLVLMNEIRNKL